MSHEDWILVNCHRCKRTMLGESMRERVMHEMHPITAKRAIAQFDFPAGQRDGFSFCAECWNEIRALALRAQLRSQGIHHERSA